MSIGSIISPTERRGSMAERPTTSAMVAKRRSFREKVFIISMERGKDDLESQVVQEKDKAPCRQEY